jgi:hypothetical protein
VVLAGCASANPAFDPLRQSETTGDESSSGGGDDVADDVADEDDRGEETGSESGDETGTVSPPICDSPELELEVRVLGDDADAFSCGHTSAAHCTMFRDPAQPEGRWQLAQCNSPLGDDTEATAYDVLFGPTGPSLDFSAERAVEFAWRHTPKDAGCELEWVQVRELEVKGGAPFDVIYAAAARLSDDSNLLIQAEPTDDVVAACTCASDEFDCCPPDAGLQGLRLSADGVPGITLESGDAPAIVDAGGLQFEAILVRAWQPPVCEAEPEYQWIARRLTP